MTTLQQQATVRRASATNLLNRLVKNDDKTLNNYQFGIFIAMVIANKDADIDASLEFDEKHLRQLPTGWLIDLSNNLEKNYPLSVPDDFFEPVELDFTDSNGGTVEYIKPTEADWHEANNKAEWVFGLLTLVNEIIEKERN